MELQELIKYLTFQYYSVIAIVAHDTPTLQEYLLQLGLSKEAIWQGNPQLGIDAEWDEPEWL